MLERTLQAYTPVIPPLPLSHATTVKRLPDIRRTGGLQPRRCPVFADDILYFFYGPPWYHKGDTMATLDEQTAHPVAFLFKAEIAVSARHVYPFDSGGFAKHFEPFFSSLMLDDFCLSCSGDIPGRIVARFFGSNHNYVVGDVADITSADPHEAALLKLYRATHGQKFDSRKHAVELLFFINLQLKDNLLLAVLPRSVNIKDPTLRPELEGLGAKVEDYEDQIAFNPYAEGEVVRHIAVRFLRNSSCL